MSSPRCPQCGADLHPPAGGGVEICGYCRTVIVHGKELRAVGRAVGERAQLAPDAWLEALTCRLCGAPLPAEAVQAEPRKVRCEYCGHKAKLSPGVLAVMKVAVTRPKALPPRLKRGVLFWAAAWALAILVISPLAVLRNDHHERREIQLVAGPSPAQAETEFEVPNFVDTHINVHFLTKQPPRVPVCLAVRFTKAGEQWNVRGGLSPSRRVRFMHQRGMGPGLYQVTVRGAAREPVPVTVRIYTWGNLSIGWLIATLNMLIFMMMLELFSSRFDRPAPVRRLIARGVIIIWLLLVLAIGVFQWNPLPRESRPEAPQPMACQVAE